MKKFIDNDKIFKVIAINKKSLKILLFLTVIVFIWVFFFSSKETSIDFLVWNNWNKFITVLTFIVAIAIGWLNYIRSWEDNLPNKLTVHFVYNEKYIMSAYTVSLSSKSDLRAWAQQIGKQMAGGNENLSFELTNSQEYLGIENNEYKHYKLTYYLSKEPKIFKQADFQNTYLTWIVEDNDNKSKGDIKQRRHARQKTSLSRDKALTEGEEYL